MTLEKTNPLPVGRYWVDVFNGDWDTFEAWLNTHTTTHALKLLRQQEFVETDGGLLGQSSPFFKARRWYLFEVLTPKAVVWNGPGFPTIAGPEIQNSDDTVQKPDVDDLPLSDVEVAARAVLGLGALIAGAWVLSSVKDLVRSVKGKG